MEKLNFFSERNIFVSYPASCEQKPKTTNALQIKDLFAKSESDVNKEIAMYLDILYKDTDEDLLKRPDAIKSSAHLPIKTQTIRQTGFYL